MVRWITSRSDSLKAIGAIAQLGERLICIQEVVGSIPSGSTSLQHLVLYTPGPVQRSMRGNKQAHPKEKSFE